MMYTFVITFGTLLFIGLGAGTGSADLEGTEGGPTYANTSNDDHNATDSHVTEHDSHDVRYQVALADFAYVASPFLISTVVLFASLAKIGFHLNNKLSSVFPESCLLIVIGILVGVILYFSPVEDYEMKSQTFFLFLLPPIVLEAGYFMPTRAFFDNLGTILLYAVVGTLFNTVLIGLTLWGLSQTSALGTDEISLLHCLVFSSLLSAVDPVAVLAVFEEIHVNEVLHIVVFGESLLNDAVTVVLYHMFEKYSEIGEDNIIAEDIVSGFFSFFIVAICGTLIGILFGFVTAFMSRFTDHVRVIEPLLVFVMGYLSYLTAEIFHFSGILACVFCGMTMKKYVEENISQKSHTTIKYFMKMLASVCETIIFMYLGISTVSQYHQWESGFVLITLIACLVYRAIGVVSLTAIANKFRLLPISGVDQFIMAYGGLRGAIAFSLVVLLDEEHFPEKNLFITTSVVVIYFTVFIQGTTIKPLVNVLRVKKFTKRKPSMNEKLNERLVDHLMAGIEDVIGHHGHHDIRERYEYLDTKYIKPLLVREKQQIARGRSILSVYQKLAEKDAHDHLAKNGSFILPRDDISRTSSLAQLFSQHNTRGNTSSSCISLDNPTGGHSIPMPNNLSSTCLDMRALDGQSEQPMIHLTDTNIHHVLDDNMFTPRKTFTRNTRHMLPTTSNHPVFHHNARLHLRKLLSHKHKHGGTRRMSSGHLKAAAAVASGSSHRLTPAGDASKPRKNVSFVDQVTIRIEESTPPPRTFATKSTDPDIEEEDRGIVFTVGPANDDQDFSSPVTAPLSPTVAETTLPWKCVPSSPPMSSRRHSLANLQDALQEQLPAWITDGAKDEETPLISSKTVPCRLDEGNLNYGQSDIDELTGVRDSKRDVDHVINTNHMTDSNHVTDTNRGSLSDTNRGSVSDTADAANITLTPSVCIFDPNENSVQSDELPAPSLTTDVHTPEDGSLPFPWKSEPQEAEPSHASQPFHQSNSYQLKPLKPTDLVSKLEISADTADISPIPPPWRHHSAPFLQSTPYPDTHTDSLDGCPGDRLDSPIKTEVECDSSIDESEQHVIPAPWKTNGDSGVTTSSGSEHRMVASHSTGTLPWRQVCRSPQEVLRTSSVAATLDSLYPHPSTHSFRLSEAESHHSQHLHHVHHLIDPITMHTAPNHHGYDGAETTTELQLDHVDMDEFISNWILNLNPDPDLPMHDTELESVGFIEISGVPVSESRDSEEEGSTGL